MAKFCKHCGAPVGPDERFCQQCGAPIGAAPTQDPQPQQQPQAQPQPEYVQNDTYADERAQGFDWKQLKPKLTIGKPEVTFMSKKKLIIYGVIILFFVILVLFKN